MAGTNKQLAAQLGLVLGVEPGQDAGYYGPRASFVGDAANLLLDGLPLTG